MIDFGSIETSVGRRVISFVPYEVQQFLEITDLFSYEDIK